MTSKVLVVGLGKLGLPVAAALAACSEPFTVVGADSDRRRVDVLNGGGCPVDEPGLADRLDAGRARMSFTGDVAAAAADADAAFVVVPTPSGRDDRFDSSAVVDAVGAVAEGFAVRARPGAPLLTVVSTVMPGTCAGPVCDAVTAAGLTPGADVHVAYHPEFIALGSVLADLAAPSVVYLGADDDAAASALWSILSRVVRAGTPARRLSLIDAEAAKLAVNVFLSVKIGYANDVARVCRAVGAEPSAVLDAVGADRRIGRGFLTAGAPPGGPCLPRDLRAWDTLGASPFVSAAHRSASHVEDRVVLACSPYARVGVLGLAYKPGSGIADDAFGWQIAQRLAGHRDEVVVHDPHVSGVPPGCRSGTVERVAGCDAVVMGCEHVDYAGFTHPRLIYP